MGCNARKTNKQTVNVYIYIYMVMVMKLPGNDQITAELINAGGRTFSLRSINLSILCGRCRWLCLFTRRVTNCSNYRHITFANYIQNFIQHPAVKVNSIRRGNYWGSSVWIPTQQVDYWSYILHSSNTWEKMGNNDTVRKLFIGFMKNYDSVRSEVLYNTLLEFGIPMKLVRIIKMCLNET
jgi:hypothetical protein